MILSSLDTSLILALVISLAFVVQSFFIVQQQSVSIVERFGKFIRTAKPGLNMKIPLIDKTAGTLSLKLCQIDVSVETKTQDDVFVNILIAVQYKVLEHKVYEAFYTLDNPDSQITAFVFDVVRAKVPHIKLDDVFAKKDDIAIAVSEELKEMMNDFGFNINKALVTDIQPDAKVKSAMNEINEAQRLRIAAMERGEAEKILKVKQAEAEAESKILQGKGIAGERRAILDGLRESFGDFEQDKIQSHLDIKPIELMSLILMSQYFDTIKEMASNGKTNTILLPHSPAGMKDIEAQIRNGIIAGNETIKNSK